ncbi:prevent-host-death family protein [Streptomyces sp. NPDC001970]
MVLTTAIHAERTAENLTTASRLFANSPLSCWTRSPTLRSPGPGIQCAARSSLARATARINADPDQLKDALRRLSGVDVGPVEVHE